VGQPDERIGMEDVAVGGGNVDVATHDDMLAIS
jgi:hypothetical protein